MPLIDWETIEDIEAGHMEFSEILEHVCLIYT